MRDGVSLIVNASWSSRIGVNARGALDTRGTAFVCGSDVGNNGIWCSTEFRINTEADEYERADARRTGEDGFDSPRVRIGYHRRLAQVRT
jgi:hypothetical protein